VIVNAVDNSVHSRFQANPLNMRTLPYLVSNSIPPTLNFVVVEVKSAAVPGARLSWLAERAGQSSPPEKSRIESRPHPQRRPPISGTSGAPIKHTRRSDQP
jgi:hypothetical protein